MNIGVFINTVISFVIVAFAIFLLIKSITPSAKTGSPAGRADNQRLPLLLVSIPIKATRCPHCTSDLKAA